jgi:hypothetical protein
MTRAAGSSPRRVAGLLLEKVVADFTHPDDELRQSLHNFHHTPSTFFQTDVR